MLYFIATHYSAHINSLMPGESSREREVGVEGQFRTAGRVAFTVLVFIAFILLWMGALHFIIGGEKPFAEGATTVFFGFAILFAIGLIGLGIKLMLSRFLGVVEEHAGALFLVFIGGASLPYLLNFEETPIAWTSLATGIGLAILYHYFALWR